MPTQCDFKENVMAEYDEELSVIGMSCPVPLIQLAKVVKTLKSGQILKITGDDPIFEDGVRDFCELQALTILNIEYATNSREISVLIQC